MAFDNIRFVCDTNFPEGLYCTGKTVPSKMREHVEFTKTVQVLHSITYVHKISSEQIVNVISEKYSGFTYDINIHDKVSIPRHIRNITEALTSNLERNILSTKPAILKPLKDTNGIMCRTTIFELKNHEAIIYFVDILNQLYGKDQWYAKGALKQRTYYYVEPASNNPKFIREDRDSTYFENIVSMYGNRYKTTLITSPDMFMQAHVYSKFGLI